MNNDEIKKAKKSDETQENKKEEKNRKPSKLLLIISIIVIIILAYSSINLNQRVALLEKNNVNVTAYNFSLLDEKISALSKLLDYVTKLAENANRYAHTH